MTVTVRSRFRGPATSGNGGYVAGVLAGRVDTGGPVTVTLRTPPPLDAVFDVTSHAGGLRLSDGDELIAEAVTADDEGVSVVPAVTPAEARRAEAGFPGLSAHPFPECFVCGPSRADGDGLRLFPGRLGDGRAACVWDVTSDVAGAGEFVWAALDCPGGWSAPIEGRPMVLGRMTAQVTGVPSVGESCVVMGQLAGTERRKTWTRSAVHGQDGRILGRAHATWIALPDIAV